MFEDMVGRIRRLTRFFLFSLAFVVLGWGFSGYPSFFAGMGLGLCIGYIGAIHLTKRVQYFGQAAAKGEPLPNLGTMTRLALVSLAAVMVMIYPHYFDYIGLVIGLMMPTVFAIGDAIYDQLKQEK